MILGTLRPSAAVDARSLQGPTAPPLPPMPNHLELEEDDHYGPSGALTWPLAMLAVYAMAGSLAWACLKMAPEPEEAPDALLEHPGASASQGTYTGCERQRWLPEE